jgi:hypothetical protein
LGCDECDNVQDSGEYYYPCRAGNDEIGWASVLIVACDAHAKVVLDKLNGCPNSDRVYYKVMPKKGGEMK